jgi:hypothetical protein
MHSSKLILVVLASLVAACGGPSTEPEPVPTCEAAIEVDWGFDDQGFVPFDDGDFCELTLGFQGFRYVDSVVRLAGSDASEAVLSFRIEVEGQEAYSQKAVQDLSAGPDGSLLAEDVLVFFNDIPVPELIGQQTTISLHVEAAVCEANDSTMVTLVDDEDCVQAPDGGYDCSGDASP